MLNAAVKRAKLTGIVALLVAPAAWAAPPTTEQALQLSPVQTEVQVDRPDKAQSAKCAIASEKHGSGSGWVVRNDSGQLLRRFVDSNGDNKVDLWCYFRDGIEVYRDIDANFNGKADQYRWLGLAGSRWGIDADEDGRVDVWKMISAEEVSAEIVAAFRDRDAARFKRLALTEEEVAGLGLSAEQSKELKTRVAAAVTGFAPLAPKQTMIGKKSNWLHFGGRHPGVLPSGSDGSTKDLFVYDNVAAVIETAGKHGQFTVGTLVKAGECWRVIDLPKNLLDKSNEADPGLFFQFAMLRKPENQEPTPQPGLSEAVQKLVNDLEKLDKEIAATQTPAKLAKLNAERADVLEKLFAAAPEEEQRISWIRQMAETVNAAVQAGAYPEGVARLKALASRIAADEKSKDLVPYVKFRYMQAEYTQSIQKSQADFPKIQEQWLTDLEQFIKDFPRAAEAAEAMLQLAIAQEFSGKDDEAIRWYGKIVQDFPSAELTKKATGAKRRLQSLGNVIAFKGTLVDGRELDLAKLRGTPVVIHYWATWCEPCKSDITELKRIQAKYPNRLTIVGISLDSDKKSVADYLKTKTLPWHHLYESGGLDSRLANELGILTLPTTLLLDKQGKVINRNVHVGELEAELKKLLP